MIQGKKGAGVDKPEKKGYNFIDKALDTAKR